MKISIFYGFPKKGAPHVSDEFMDLLEFLNKVKYGEWKKEIELVRTEQEKKKRNLLKANLPSVTISGVFGERKESELLEHSGFICIDIDDFDDKTQLLEDPYTYALLKSASGNGLAAIVKINTDKHKESFKWLQGYYFKHYGIVVDPAPQNPASLRFVSYDPDLYINEKSRKSLTKSLKEKKNKSLPVVVPTDKVGEYVNEVVSRGYDMAPDYFTYRNLGFALAEGFGESGRQYFHSLCSVNEKYNSRHTDKQYSECLKGRKAGIGIGTFYWMLKEAGVDIGTENKRLVNVATMGKEAKRTKEAVVNQLVELEGVNKKDASELVDEVYKRNDIDINKSIETPAELIEGLMKWLDLNHPMKRNEISKRVEDNNIELSKERFNMVYLRAQMFFNTKDVTKDLMRSIIYSEFTKGYNPITEYIENNNFRNSTGNIDRIIKTIRSTNPKMDRVFIRKWLLSIIAAYKYNPVRSVLSLIGGQNTGKSEWFRRLLPDGLKYYYGESKLNQEKDDKILMCEKLIIIDDEMGGKSKTDEKAFKELTSKRVFSLRKSYGENNEDFKRLAILGGTSNDKAIINDPTGNTRLLPINIISIDHELYNSIDKDELFMEIYREFESGAEWELNDDERKELGLLSGEFEQMPFERELIQQYFKSPESVGSNDSIEKLSSVQIKEVIEEYSNQKIQNIRRFQMECTNYFGNSKIISIDGDKRRVYDVSRRKPGKGNLEDDLPF